jgi:hypothetical protein
MIILSDGYLECVLRSYCDHFNRARPHQGIGQRIQSQRSASPLADSDRSRRSLCWAASTTTIALLRSVDERGSQYGHTGRTTCDPPPGGYPEVCCIVGRQSGKTRVAATIAAFEAVLAERE